MSTRKLTQAGLLASLAALMLLTPFWFPVPGLSVLVPASAPLPVALVFRLQDAGDALTAAAAASLVTLPFHGVFNTLFDVLFLGLTGLTLGWSTRDGRFTWWGIPLVGASFYLVLLFNLAWASLFLHQDVLVQPIVLLIQTARQVLVSLQHWIHWPAAFVLLDQLLNLAQQLAFWVGLLAVGAVGLAYGMVAYPLGRWALERLVRIRQLID